MKSRIAKRVTAGLISMSLIFSGTTGGIPSVMASDNEILADDFAEDASTEITEGQTPRINLSTEEESLDAEIIDEEMIADESLMDSVPVEDTEVDMSAGTDNFFEVEGITEVEDPSASETEVFTETEFADADDIGEAISGYTSFTRVGTGTYEEQNFESLSAWGFDKNFGQQLFEEERRIYDTFCEMAEGDLRDCTEETPIVLESLYDRSFTIAEDEYLNQTWEQNPDIAAAIEEVRLAAARAADAFLHDSKSAYFVSAMQLRLKIDFVKEDQTYTGRITELQFVPVFCNDAQLDELNMIMQNETSIVEEINGSCVGGEKAGIVRAVSRYLQEHCEDMQVRVKCLTYLLRNWDTTAITVAGCYLSSTADGAQLYSNAMWNQILMDDGQWYLLDMGQTAFALLGQVDTSAYIPCGRFSAVDYEPFAYAELAAESMKDETEETEIKAEAEETEIEDETAELEEKEPETDAGEAETATEDIEIETEKTEIEDETAELERETETDVEETETAMEETEIETEEVEAKETEIETGEVETEEAETETGEVETEETETETESEMLGAASIALASELSGEDFLYTVSGDEIKITAFTGTSTAVVIPEMIDGKAVTEIANNATKGNTTITSVVFPKTIKTVGSSAFADCTSLASVRFQYNDGTDYTSDNKEVAYRATVGDSAFSGCTSLTNVDLSANVVSLGNYVFDGCTALATLTLPEKLETMGYYVIRDTQISEITIPKTIKKTRDAHDDGSYNKHNGALAGAKALKRVVFEDGIKEIPSSVAASESYTSQIQDVVLPEGVQAIGSYAFYQCDKIPSVTFPKTIKTVGTSAYSGCTSLAGVRFQYNEGTEYTQENEEVLYQATIGNYAFSGCTSLTDVELSANVVSVGDSAFSGCTSLEGVALPANVTGLGSYVFDGCTSLAMLTLPEKLETMGYYVIRDTQISEITIPKTIKKTRDAYADGSYNKHNGALAGAKALKRVVFEDGIKEIPSSVAASESYTSQIESVVIPDSVTSIGNYAFYKCDKMEIYGYEGSYADIYAFENNIPFHSVAISKMATAEDVLKKLNLASLINNIDISGGKIYGPTVNVAGQSFHLFEMDAAMELKVSDSLQAKVDVENKTVQVLVGFGKFDGSATLDPDTNSSTYWSESYKQVKELYTGITGNKVSDTRLWNKFSSLRSKLKKHKASLVIDADAFITGYIEFSYSSGEIAFREGGLIMGAELGATYDQRIPAFPAAYATFGLKAGLNGTLKLVREASRSYSLSLDATLTLAATLGLGIGSKKLDTYAEGGLEGELITGLKLPASTLEEALTIDLKGRVYFKSAVLGFEGPNFKQEFGNGVRIYPSTDSAQMILFDGADILDVNAVQMNTMSRDYLTAGVQTAALEEDVPESIFTQNGTYPYSIPKIAELSDGTKLMIWIGDTGEKDSVNRTSLMYSIYSGKAWSEPKALYETGGLNDYPDLYTDGDTVYLVWTKTANALPQDATLEDALSSTDLCYVTYSDGQFSEITMLTDSADRTYEMLQRIASNRGDTSIVWVENSENDPFMASGTNSIKLKRNSGSGWAEETLAENIQSVSSLAVCYVDGEPAVMYETAQKESAVYLTWKGRTMQFEGEDACLSDGMLYYSKSGNLQIYDIVTGDTIDSGSMETRDYTVVSGNGVTYLLTVQSDGFANELYGALYDEVAGSWGKAVQLTDYGKYIRSYSAQIDANGQLVVVMNVVDLDAQSGDVSDKASVLAVELNSALDISVSDVVYDDSQVVPGSALVLNFQVTNNSLKPIDTLQVSIKDEKGTELENGILSCQIEPGGTAAASFVYHLPAELALHTIEVCAQVEGETNLSDNSEEVTIGYADLQLQNIHLAGTAAKPYLAGEVANVGYTEASGGTVTVYRDNVEGSKLGTQEISSLAPGEATEFSIEIPADQIVTVFPTAGNDFYVSLQADAGVTETRIENNSCYYLLKADEENKLGLNYSELVMKTGETKTLTVAYTGSVTDVPKLQWSSSDDTVVSVEDGMITALSAGHATITVKAGAQRMSCEVTVSGGNKVTGITLSEQSVSLNIGGTRQLTATVLPENADNQKVQWESADEGIATVSDSGLVTGVAIGTTEITAISEDGFWRASCEISVTEDKAKYFVVLFKGGDGAEGSAPKAISTQGGDVFKLPENTFTNGILTFTGWSDGENIRKPGESYRMPYHNVTFTAQWDTDKVLVEEIRLSSSSLEMKVGETAELLAEVLPEDAENAELLWNSSDSAVIQVDNGKLTALKEGSAVVSAASTDGSEVSASCTVNVSKKERTILGTVQYSKKVGDEPFDLDVMLSEGEGNLTYTSDNRSVAIVDSAGMVAVVGIGTAVITVSAAGTEEYQKAELAITITVTQSDSDKPGDPSNPSNPNSPSGSDSPTDPGNPNSPSGSDSPTNPSNPNSPDGSDSPTNPSNPNSPDGSDSPTDPGNPNSSSGLGSPTNPDNSSSSNNQAAPDNSDNPDGHTHDWDEGKITKEATVFEEGERTRSCKICGVTDSISIEKLQPTIMVNVKSIPLRKKQATSKVKVSGLAKGDSIVSWESSNNKIVKVNGNGKITAQKKTGKATITVTLKSGLSQKIKVKVQKKAVACKKIKLNKSSVTLSKGKTFKLVPELKPITCVQKAVYKSSDKRIATVSSKGVIKAKKKGKVTITLKVGKKKVKCKVAVK